MIVGNTKYGNYTFTQSAVVITGLDTFLLDTEGSGILCLNGYSIILAVISNENTLTERVKVRSKEDLSL